MKFTSRSLEETSIFATQCAVELLSEKSDGKNTSSVKAARVICLYGNLGSGKTTFTQAFARALGIKEIVTSPTYVIEKIYPLFNSLSTVESQVFTHLIHIDAYRLENFTEMEHLGWKEIVANPQNIIIIEWPERIAELLPQNHISIMFTFIDETTREIEMVQ